MKTSSIHSYKFRKQKQDQSILRIDPQIISQQFLNALVQASNVLNHEQFFKLYENMMLKLIYRAERQTIYNQAVYHATICECLKLYGGTIEMIIRNLLLQTLILISSSQQQKAVSNIQKVKILIQNSEFSYLMCKVYILQYKIYSNRGQQKQIKQVLRTCIKRFQVYPEIYQQLHLMAKREIIQSLIIANYQLFNQKRQGGLKYIEQAVNLARNGFGIDSKVYKLFIQKYKKQQNILSHYERFNNKNNGISDIFEIQLEGQPFCKILAFYSWQTSKIVLQIIKQKNYQRKVLNQKSYSLGLDINKLQLLKSETTWCFASRQGQLGIIDDQLQKLIGLRIHKQQPKVSFKQLSREQVIKKTTISSSDSQQDPFHKQQLQFLKPQKAQSARRPR